MSSLSNEDIMMWMNNSNLLKPEMEYRRKVIPKPYQYSIVIQRTVFKSDCQSMNVIDIFTDGTRPRTFVDGTKPNIIADGTRPKIFADGTRPKIFADGTRPRIFADGTRPRIFADGTRPKIFADGTRPRIFADGTRPKIFADGTRPRSFNDGTIPRSFADGTRPRSFADGTRPRSFADGTRPRSFADETIPRSFVDGTKPWNGIAVAPANVTDGKDVAAGEIVLTGTEPKSVGRQQNDDEDVDKYVLLTNAKNDKDELHRYCLAYDPLGLNPSWAKFYKCVNDRLEYLPRSSSRQSIQKFMPSDLYMPSLVSFGVESETDDLMGFIVIDRELISNIEEEDMDGIIFDWLNLLGLDKYYWFFKQLSFNEIKYVSEDNFYKFLDKMDKSRDCIDQYGVAKICQVTKNLRERPKKLSYLITALDAKVAVIELSEHVDYLVYILQYPVPNKNCTTRQKNGTPQFELYLIMQKIFKRLMEVLGETSILYRNSILVSVICKFTKCVKLIHHNQLFFEYQVEGVIMLARSLWRTVEAMKRKKN